VTSIQEETHPCFTLRCSKYARVHLPIAPVCNVQCNYCLRKYCCANECRPGVTARVMEPKEALAWYLKAKASYPELTVVGVAGPGDALANWTRVEEGLRLIREQDKKIKLCLSTNGLLLADYAEKIVAAGIGYVTVTVNSLEPEINSKIYSYISYKSKRYTGNEAGKILLENQLEGIRLLNKNAIKVKINFVAIPEVNLEQALPVAEAVHSLGCEVMNIIPMLPVEGTPFASYKAPLPKQIKRLREDCRPFVRQMEHCRRCRADACGTLKL